jgi:hypothetical protein
VTLDPTSVPGPITDLEVVRNGDSSAPDSIDIRWPMPVDGQVHALTVGYTQRLSGVVPYAQCITDGAAREMLVEPEVLAPFAGAFKLEWVDHGHFAAANTPAGCIEIHYVYRYWHSRSW